MRTGGKDKDKFAGRYAWPQDAMAEILKRCEEEVFSPLQNHMKTNTCSLKSEGLLLVFVKLSEKQA